MLRPVAVQVVEAHCPTQRGGGTAERLQLGPTSKAPATPLVSVSSIVTAAVQDWFNPWLQQLEQARASVRGWRTLKKDDEMWGSDEDGDEVNGELKDTGYLDGDAQTEVGDVGCEKIWCSWVCF